MCKMIGYADVLRYGIEFAAMCIVGIVLAYIVQRIQEWWGKGG